MQAIIDADQYDRQKRVAGWEQGRISDSKCLVAGAGALGNEVVKNLVQLGVGSIVVVDFDTIVTANLNRCVFFTPEDADAGRLKAEVLAMRASKLNGDCKITPLLKHVEELPESLFSQGGFTAVFSCLDNLGARLHLNAHCYGKVPLIDGGTSGFFGKVQVVSAPGACLECPMTKRDYGIMWRKYSCVGTGLDFIDPKMPALPTTTSIVAGIQASEFVKLAHSGKPLGGTNHLTQLPRKTEARKFAFPSSSLEGRYLFANCLTGAFASYALSRRDSCPVHPSE